MSRDDLLPAGHSLTLLAMIGGNVAAAVWLPVLCWITVPIAVLAMTGALSVVHEASHATYFSSRLANRIVGRIFALLILINFSLYRRDHMLHHGHFGTERDTEELKHINCIRDLAVALVFNDHAVVHWRRSLAAAFGVEGSATLRRDAWSLIAALILAAGATVAWPALVVLGVWVPLSVSLLLDNMVSLPEHAVIGPANAASELTSRNIAASRLTEFVLYYVNHHNEHHANPRIGGAAASTRCSSESRCYASYAGFYGSAARSLLRRDSPFVRDRIGQSAARSYIRSRGPREDRPEPRLHSAD